MKSIGFMKSLLRFFRNALIMIFINTGVGYLIARALGSLTMEGYGRVMIMLGCLYMLIGLGSMSGHSKYRNNISNIYAQSISGRSLREYGADDVSRFDKNFSFTLHGAFVGGMTLIMGLLLFRQ